MLRRIPSASVSGTGPWIESQVAIGRNAVSVFQDLVELHGFTHQHNSVKRFVATLKARAPERFDVLEFLPGEEAQVDYGQGPPSAFRGCCRYVVLDNLCKSRPMISMAVWPPGMRPVAGR